MDARCPLRCDRDPGGPSPGSHQLSPASCPLDEGRSPPLPRGLTCHAARTRRPRHTWLARIELPDGRQLHARVLASGSGEARAFLALRYGYRRIVFGPHRLRAAPLSPR